MLTYFHCCTCLIECLLGIVSEVLGRKYTGRYLKRWYSYVIIIAILVALIVKKQYFHFSYIISWFGGVTTGTQVCYLTWWHLFVAIINAMFAVLVARIFLPYLIRNDQLFFGFTSAIMTTPLIHFSLRVFKHNMKFIRRCLGDIAALARHLSIFAFRMTRDVKDLYWRIGTDVLGLVVTLIFSVGIWYFVFRHLYKDRFPSIWEHATLMYQQVKFFVWMFHRYRIWTLDTAYKWISYVAQNWPFGL
jgi:hypothetical protein